MICDILSGLVCAVIRALRQEGPTHEGPSKSRQRTIFRRDEDRRIADPRGLIPVTVDTFETDDNMTTDRDRNGLHSRFDSRERFFRALAEQSAPILVT